MLRDTIIDRWVKELDKEIYDLLEFREELAGERLVIEDGADRQCAMAAPSDGIKHDEQKESRRKIFEVIREEHYFKGDEEQALGIIELLLSKSGKTIQDALDTLKDAKAILLRYHYIC